MLFFRLDHHCPCKLNFIFYFSLEQKKNNLWYLGINNCVGEFNQKYFYFYFFSISVKI